MVQTSIVSEPTAVHKVIDLCAPCSASVDCHGSFGGSSGCGAGGIALEEVVRLRYCVAEDDGAVANADEIRFMIRDLYGVRFAPATVDPADTTCVYTDTKFCTVGPVDAWLTIRKGTSVISTEIKRFCIG